MKYIIKTKIKREEWNDANPEKKPMTERRLAKIAGISNVTISNLGNIEKAPKWIERIVNFEAIVPSNFMSFIKIENGEYSIDLKELKNQIGIKYKDNRIPTNAEILKQAGFAGVVAPTGKWIEITYRICKALDCNPSDIIILA